VTPAATLTLDQLQRIPAETLAHVLLQRIPDNQMVNRGRIMLDVLMEARGPRPAQMATRSDDLMHDYPRETVALAEAWQRLVLDGLIVNWPPKDPQFNSSGFGEMFQLTRWGRQVRARGDDAPALLAARRRLGVELHPRLAGRLRDSAAVGDFEQAALVALRAIEARVRELADDPRGGRGERLTGTALMQHAFAPDGGPLTDPDAERGERVGTMSLFAGAFGAIRNSLAHTEVEWSDPTEAAEYVLLADLLMRMLDRAAQRVGR
jgi:uncharacterized protein (TIGR02391 family)